MESGKMKIEAEKMKNFHNVLALFEKLVYNTTVLH